MSEQSAARVLEGVARHGLEREPTVIDQMDDISWLEFSSAADDQRLTGLTAAKLLDGSLQLEPARREWVLDRQRATMSACLGLERILLRAVDALETAGIEAIVLKGPALAHCFYPDPSWRPFGDADLLVHTNQFHDASAILAGLGFARRLPEPRPGFDERFGKAAVHVDADGSQIDLHRTLVVGPFGLWMKPEELFERTVEFELGGRRLKRLDDTVSFVHACMHAALGWRPPLLLPLRDLAQAAVCGDPDWPGVEALLTEWRLSGVAAYAVATAEQRLGMELPDEARRIKGSVAGRWERRALAAYTTDARQRGGTALLTLAAIPGVRAKGAYVRALVFPGREFLTARAPNGEPPSYLKRWGAPIKWIKGGQRWT